MTLNQKKNRWATKLRISLIPKTGIKAISLGIFKDSTSGFLAFGCGDYDFGLWVTQRYKAFRKTPKVVPKLVPLSQCNAHYKGSTYVLQVNVRGGQLLFISVECITSK